MSNYRRRCPAASWVVLERLCGIVEAGLQVVLRCPAATWSRGAMPMPGQRVGGYLHGYLLTIGG